MKTKGHMLFAVIVTLFGVYLLKNFTQLEISYGFVILHLPFLLVGSIIIDKMEPMRFYGDFNHRYFFHSWIFGIGLVILSILTYDHFLSSPKDYFLEIPISWISSSLFLFVGMITHIVGDKF